MKKIGFIDRHLNNFHADHYVELIRKGGFKGEMDVVYAFGDTPYNGVDTRQWCEKNRVQELSTPAEVVEKSDFIFVLSPDNPERHEDLAVDALKSGKPVYVDKTFAPDFAAARYMIELAKMNNTPMFTTSALRFVPDITGFLEGAGKDRKVRAAALRGPGAFENYLIHIVEPMVMLLGHSAKSINYFGNGDFVLFTVRYEDGRIGTLNQFKPSGSIGGKYFGQPFEANVMFNGGTASLTFKTDRIFDDLVDSICRFFLGAPSPAPYEDTLEIMAVIDAGMKAVKNPGQWIDIPDRT